MRFRSVVGVLGLLLVAPTVRVGAQQRSSTATVAVTLTVLPQSSFERSDDRPLTADVVPGEMVRVAPSAGVRTRMSHSAAALVQVSGGPLVGPGGAQVAVRFVCAFGGGMTVSAAEPFDCVDGLLTTADGVRVSSIPLAIGTEVNARETGGATPGVYTGRVVITATYPAY